MTAPDRHRADIADTVEISETAKTAKTNSKVVSDDDVRRERYEEKHDADGSALNPDRDALYDNLTGVGESGAQGSEIGREDQNTIGPNGQP